MARDHDGRELEKWAHRLDQAPIFVGRRDEFLTKSLYPYLVFFSAPRNVQQVLGWCFAAPLFYCIISGSGVGMTTLAQLAVRLRCVRARNAAASGSPFFVNLTGAKT